MLVGHYDMLATTLHTLRVQPEDTMTFTTRPTLEGTFGMVSSTHWLASQSAQRMLELGGNAFDAAAAGGFVLHVVEPHLNGPGGDLPAIVATAADPTPRVLCGQGPAPAGATPEAFAAMGLDHVPGSGPLAAAVPGAVDAWLLLLRDHGSLPLATVLEPAIGYARDGHPLLARVAATIDRMQDLFRESWTTSADLWLRDGRVPRAGELFANPVYASVLERLVDAATAAGPDVAAQAQAARDAWGHGFVAEAVEAFRSTEWRHSGGEVLPGLVGGDDLAAFSATWEDAGHRGVARRPGREDRPVGPGPCAAAGAGDARRARIRRRWTRRPRTASTRSPSAGSWRWPTARPGSATAARSRSTTCWPPTTWPSGPPWSGRSPISAYALGRRVVASRACRGTCSACSPARRPAVPPT